MPRELLSPEAARLEAGRLNVRERLRWLAPNARRAKELMAEQRRLTIAALKAEVARKPESQNSGKPELSEPEQRRPRFWWVEHDS